MATYLVTCATGQQGSAIIKYLIIAGVKIHAVVRNIHSDKSRQLESQGVQLFEGDNDNFDLFREAARGCKGLYLNLQLSPTDPTAQQRQAHGIVSACKEAGVETIVLSTAYFTGNRSKWDNDLGKESGVWGYYTAKAQMEDAVREAGVKHYTILRPAWFYSNYLLPYSTLPFPSFAEAGELVHSYDVGTKMSHIDEDTIGNYAAAALLDPEKFNGQEIELGGENLTIDEVADILRKVSGYNVRVRKRTPAEVLAAKNVVPTQVFNLLANEVDLSIDGESIQRKYGIHMTGFEEYLEREKRQLRVSLPF